MFAAPQNPFDGAGFINQRPAQPEAGRTALAVAFPDQAALTGKHLGGELPAVLASHGALDALDALDDGRDRAAIVVELLGTILDRDASPFADIFVIGVLVGVLEAALPADPASRGDIERSVLADRRADGSSASLFSQEPR